MGQLDSPREAVWSENGVTCISDPETGIVIHDPTISVEEGNKVTGVKIITSDGETISTTDYYRPAAGDRKVVPTTTGEECVYVGQELRKEDGSTVTVTGIEYNKDGFPVRREGPGATIN